MKSYLAPFLITLALGLCVGSGCYDVPAKPEQSIGSNRLSSDEIQSGRGDGVFFKENARPYTLQCNGADTASKHSSATHDSRDLARGALIDESPGVPVSPLDLTLAELAADMRLKDEQDPARRAELEAEVVKLREQLHSRYDPVVQE